MTSKLLATEMALGMLHSFSFCAYSPWREITVQAFEVRAPFTYALLREPEAMAWQAELVQLTVSPQPFCAWTCTETKPKKRTYGSKKAAKTANWRRRFTQKSIVKVICSVSPLTTFTLLKVFWKPLIEVLFTN